MTLLPTRIFALLVALTSLGEMSQAFTLPGIAKAASALGNAVLFDSKQTLVLSPPESKKQGSETCVILLPGCQLRPQQYEAVAAKIQQSSDQAVWVAIPKLPLDVANPLVIPGIVKSTLKEVQEQGYEGDKAFVGGHSLGGVFLPTVFDESNGLNEQQVLGTINLGCFKARNTPEDSMLQKIPSLTMTGDLDGMVRTSRIAEDCHRNVKGDSVEAKLHHAVVLVEGMNHFGFVQGRAPLIKQLRDLRQEITHEDAVAQVGTAIASFMDVHSKVPASHTAKSYLLKQIDDTADYLQPLIEALKLEGSQHTGCDRANGSPWATKMQRELLKACDSEIKDDMMFSDESHASWYLNPFAEVPFFHPKVTKSENGVELETMSDPIYEKTDSAFDGGFFSNAVSELRCKFLSPQAVVEEATGKKVPFLPPKNFAKKLNQQTIDWARENAPARVRRRYEQQGIQLIPRDDVPHNSGPAWIWSYLSYGKGKGKDGKSYRELRSHTMVTPTDHPIPAAGGKMYCKLLSPAKALDWMYTDSLRTEINPIKLLLNEELVQLNVMEPQLEPVV